MKMNIATATVVDALLTKQQICTLLSVSRATLDRWVRENPEFPQPRRITGQTIRWRASEIARYIDGLPRVAYDDHAFDPNEAGGGGAGCDWGLDLDDDADPAVPFP